MARARAEELVNVQVRLAKVGHGALEGDEGAILLPREADAHALPARAPASERHANLADALRHEVTVQVGAQSGVQDAAAKRPLLPTLPPRTQ